MTTIITRLYPDHASAHVVVSALQAKGLDEETIRIIAAEEGSDVFARMRAVRVSEVAATAYAKAMKPGNALVVVTAGFNPTGAARTAIRTVNRFPALDVGLADEDRYIREHLTVAASRNLVAGNPLVMSNPFSSPSHGHILGSNPIIASRPRTSAIRGGGYMSRMFWPMKLVSQKTSTSAVRGGFLVSSMFGLPTVIRSWPPRDLVPTKV